MASLYFDHNVSHDVGPPLWSFGHDLIFSRDVGSTTLPDDAMLLSAVQTGRVLITHNRRDFRMLHDAWITWPSAFGLALPTHPGILILDQVRPEVLAEVLAAFLGDVPAEHLANGIFWWHRYDGWRQPVAGARWGPIQRRDVSEQE